MVFEKIFNNIASRQLILFNLLLIGSTLIKLIFFQFDLKNIITELFVLVIMNGYIVIKKMKKNLDLETNIKYNEKGYMIGLYSCIISEFIIYFVLNYKILALSYLPIWLFPTFLLAIKSKKSRKTIFSNVIDVDTNVYKSLKIRTIIGSICFGICLCGNHIYSNGAFNLTGILWVVYSAVGFGVLFYLIFRNLIK